MKVSSLGSWRYLRWQMKVSSSKNASLNGRSVSLIPSVVLPYACPFLCICVLAKSYTARTGVLPLEDRSPTGPVWQSCPGGTCPARACLLRSGLPLLPPFPFPARNIYKGVLFLSPKSSPVNVCFITVWHSMYCIKRWNFFKKKCPLLLQVRKKAVPLHSLSGSNAADEAVKPWKPMSSMIGFR